MQIAIRQCQTGAIIQFHKTHNSKGDFFENTFSKLKLCNSEILLVHLSTPLNQYDEKFFSLNQKQQLYCKNSTRVFLSGIVIMSIVKFSKIIIEKIWQHSIIKFKHKFCVFRIYQVI